MRDPKKEEEEDGVGEQGRRDSWGRGKLKTNTCPNNYFSFPLSPPPIPSLCSLAALLTSFSSPLLSPLILNPISSQHYLWAYVFLNHFPGGRVLTWGRGTSGQLGHGEMINSLQPKPVRSLESSVITHVSAGWSHSGFVSDVGCLFTCGDGSFGQLGHGDYQSHCSPVKVSCFGSKHVEKIACGMRHSLVLLKGQSGDQVYGFGSGKRGQLGISKDKIKSISLPQVTFGFEDVEIISISANGDHSAALSADGHLYSWGRGFSGTSDAYYPERLPSSLWFTQVALGWNHALVLTGDGEVFMLGGNHHGVLSDPQKLSPAKHLSEYSSNSREVFIEKVPDLDDSKVMQIAAGAEHSAVVTENGVVKTWGWGEHGQLGLGNTCDQICPQVVSLGHKLLNKHATFNVYCGSGFTFVVKTICSPAQT